MPLRLHDGRLLLIECKVSNEGTNSVKRLNREVGGKARDLSRDLGAVAVPAVVREPLGVERRDDDERRLLAERLQQLYRLRLTERVPVATDHRGTPPYAHRLTYHVRQRLGYRTDRPQLSSRLRHLLDSHDVVCALAQPIPDAPHGPMQAWLTAPMAGRILGNAVEPDGVVILQLRARSAVVCIELDEGTEHHPVIIDKLERYVAQLRDRNGWHLLFVVPGRDRWSACDAWPCGRASQCAGAWIALQADVRRRGLNADAYPAWSVQAPVALADLIDDHRDRSSAAPVASGAWLDLLATGGVEDFDRLLTGTRPERFRPPPPIQS
ncbi:MAG: replication-relaxation family protein [Chloroflexota bacterium]|nr:replication-relaxation family protein [Chloroflexota bacterium]